MIGMVSWQALLAKDALFDSGGIMAKKNVIKAGTPTTSPFSPGLAVDSWVFVSGQVGIDPVSGTFSKTIKEQTTVTLNNVKGILEAGGVTAANIVKVTVYMTDIKQFADMNEAYKKFFEANKVVDLPTRTTVGVAGLAREGLLVEIDAIAIK